MQSSTIVHGNPNNTATSAYQKFGTVAGYTQVHHNRPAIDMQNTFNHPNEELASEAAAAAQALANNRMRAINRSFRRAVDKSFDVVVPISNSAAANTATTPSNGKFKLLNF